ncbi:MAG TPA: P-loop NTPase fold protein [Candidatus Saccharimonadales bacterium]|nr:P-loop NTPase fold protein [Candidatus Saccharimonadales bacterium]
MRCFFVIHAERPIENERLYRDDCESLGVTPEDDPVFNEILKLHNLITKDTDKRGRAINISGTHGIGKTTFTNILRSKLEPEYLVINARSMFYGNFDEYIGGVLSDFYQEFKSRFGIRLSELTKLSQNVTLSLEAGLHLGVFSIRANGSRTFIFKKSTSSESLLHSDSPLNKKLSSIFPQRVVIIIDDLDRLKPRELVTALRLIEVLRWLNNVFVIAVGNTRHMGDTLLLAELSNPHEFARKVFDYKVHLKRTLRQLEHIAHVMVRRLVGTDLNEAQKAVISEAYYFLILRHIIKNIQDLAKEAIDGSNVGPTTGKFWDWLMAAGHDTLGPIYDELRQSYSTWALSEDKHRRTHNIWTVTEDQIIPEDYRKDGLALLTTRPNIDLQPWDTHKIFKKLTLPAYWSQKIIPSPDQTAKTEKYMYNENAKTVHEMFSRLDAGESLPRTMLGSVLPESRWSIARKFMADHKRSEMDNDFSLTNLNDLRHFNKKFVTGVHQHLPKLLELSDPQHEHERLKLYTECVDDFENAIKIERGES